jgi:multicomponent Na+:H+ antiporter subunit D
VIIVVLLVLLMSAVLCAAVRCPRIQWWTGVFSGLLVLSAAIGLLLETLQHGFSVVEVGDWGPVVGITLVADRLSALLVLATSGVLLAALLATGSPLDDGPRPQAEIPLLFALATGVSLAFCTGDLFNLYVSFEVMLMASFVLLSLGRGPREVLRLDAAVGYVTLNLLASALFLAGCGLAYATCGTLNLARLAEAVQAGGGVTATGTGLAAMALLAGAFAIKAGAFPLFAWLPASYHTPRTASLTMFSGLLTKVGVYALLRLTTLVFPLSTGPMAGWLYGTALLTMVVGVVGAAGQYDARRILSWHIISQVGYMLLALALGTATALAACVFYLVHHIVVKSNLFLLAGINARLAGSDDVRQQHGLGRHPWLHAGFVVAAFSLAGLPPLSGFFAKLAVLKGALELQDWWALGIGLGVSFLTLYSMIKLHRGYQWRPAADHADHGAPTSDAPRSPIGPALAGVLLLAAWTVAVGLAAGPLWSLCSSIGSELLERRAYLDAVLGARP